MDKCNLLDLSDSIFETSLEQLRENIEREISNPKKPLSNEQNVLTLDDNLVTIASETTEEYQKQIGEDILIMEKVKVCKTQVAPPAVNKDSPVIMGRPLVLGKEKWNNIRSHLQRSDESLEIQEQERKYKEFLMEGSRELTKKWPETIHKDGGDQKTVPVDTKGEQQEKLREMEYLRIKENDEKLRRENIAKAQHLITRLKPGPRELESAAILCEVLKGREIQTQVNAEFKRTLQEYNRKEDAKMQAQAVPWIEEEQKKIVDNRKRNEEYKNELIRTIREDERTRAENNKKQKEVERKIREQADKDLQAQIERERAALQRKKETMRKNALEAMKMVEQRRLRDKLELAIDNQIRAIFTNGKQNINNIKKEKEKQLYKEKMQKIEINAQKLAALNTNDTKLEEEKLQKAVDETNAKLDQQEREKIQKEKMMKAARIKSYMDDLEKKKMLKAQECEQYRWDLANRYKNVEVNQDFERQRAQEKIKKAREIRAALLEQMKEKQLNEKANKKIDQTIANIPNDENKLFLQYADVLIEDAKNKARPIRPLLKVVEKFKKENEIDIERTEPRHLKSNVPIDGKGSNETCSPKACGQPIIKYDLNELKQLNPRPRSRAHLWP